MQGKGGAGYGQRGGAGRKVPGGRRRTQRDLIVPKKTQRGRRQPDKPNSILPVLLPPGVWAGGYGDAATAPGWMQACGLPSWCSLQRLGVAAKPGLDQSESGFGSMGSWSRSTTLPYPPQPRR